MADGVDELAAGPQHVCDREVPTIGELLKTLDQARSEDAYTAEAEYAADGHPVRTTLDWDKNSIDDEALYVIGSYEPNPD